MANATELSIVAPAKLLGVAGGMAITRLDFATYDGSHEVVHPDVLRFPSGWGGSKFWAVLTPYPNSAVQFENPSLFTSGDGNSWSVPAGLKNPIRTTNRGYLSDPDMLYDPVAKNLRMYYREVSRRKVAGKEMHAADVVWTTTSTNGVQWSAPQIAAQDNLRYVVSPTVVRGEDGTWRMWSVDAGKEGCATRATKLRLRTSTDGVRWGAPADVQLAQAGYNPWHVDVQWVPARSEYWALVAAYPSTGSCATTDLFLATSKDGKAWTTYRTPVLSHGAVPEFDTNVYRSTFAHTGDDSVTFWFTGARTTVQAAKGQLPVLQWNAGTARISVADLFARVQAAPSPVRYALKPGGANASFLRGIAEQNAMP